MSTNIESLIRSLFQKFIDEDLVAFRDVCLGGEIRRGRPGEIEIYLKIKKVGESVSVDRFICVQIHDNEPSVGITAIVVPSELAHNGLGKRLIKKLYEALKLHGYALVVVGLVPSFYRSLVRRRAHVLSNEDVQITDCTDLA